MQHVGSQSNFLVPSTMTTTTSLLVCRHSKRAIFVSSLHPCNKRSKIFTRRRLGAVSCSAHSWLLEHTLYVHKSILTLSVWTANGDVRRFCRVAAFVAVKVAVLCCWGFVFFFARNGSNLIHNRCCTAGKTFAWHRNALWKQTGFMKVDGSVALSWRCFTAKIMEM